TDLRELICLIRGARYAVSNDSGPMHIAAAVGKPVIAVFGPTNPVRTGPYGAGHRVVQAEMPCVPCYKKTCRHLRCMEAVSVEQVYDAVKSVNPSIA
ncbi:MAG TPA: glycosyltransferase family 9 protein, partial [Dissulfurispiraceae bacterium]|nr:glycosyltransferase family 9 protein [Dissulfurispiraceae bacterium]